MINRTAAIIRPRLRPSAEATTPPTIPPNTQPISALDTAKPASELAGRLAQAERRNEIQIEVLHRSRDHRGIVAEKQTAECRYQCQEHQVAVIFIHSGMF